MSKISDCIANPWKSGGEHHLVSMESGHSLEMKDKSDDFQKVNLFQLLQQNKLLPFLKQHSNNDLILREEINNVDKEKHSLLHYAVRNRQVEVVQKLIDLGGDLKARNPNGATPFHFACRYLKCSEEKVTLQILNTLASAESFNILARDWSESTGLHQAAARGNLTTVKFILDHPLFNKNNIDCKDELGNTPLLKAALEGKAEVVQHLLEKGASLNCTCKFNQNSIHKAALNGFIEVVKVIKIMDQDSYKDLVQQKDIGKSTVLHLAVYGGALEIVQLLRQDGFIKTQILETNESLETPLHRAARRNLTTFINIFLDEGANINALNSKNQSPLHVASENGHKEAVNALIRDEISLEPRAETDLNIKDNFYQTPIIAALIKGDEAVFNVLNKAGAHIDVKNNIGQNLLHILVLHDKLQVLDDVLSIVEKDKVLKLLIDNDFKEQNPLHIAARVGNLTKVGEILLDKSICKDEFAKLLKVKNDDNESPFHIATKQGNQELMNEILKSYPEAVYQLARDGNTASHLAAKHNQPECLRMLLNRSLELSPFNARYRTPLDCAAEGGSLECVRILLENGYTLAKSSLNSTSPKLFPNNPLHLSAMNGHYEIVKVLIEEGADISEKDMSGKTPLQIALEKDHKSVVKAILTSSAWEQALRTAYHSDDKDKSLITPLRALIQTYPDLAELVLDKLSTDRSGDMLFSIEFLEDSFLIKPCEESKDEYDFIDGDNNKFLKNTYYNEDKDLKMVHPMRLMLENQQEELLKHPLTIALTKYKWNTYGSKLFIFEALIYILYLSTFTAYSFITLNHEKDLNSSQIARLDPCRPTDYSLFLNLLFYTSIICVSTCVIYELTKIQCHRYLITFFQKILLYCSVLAWFLHYSEVDECSSKGTWKWANCAILLSTSHINFLRYFMYYSFYGVFLIMFKKILYTVLKLMTLIIIFVMAFGMSFYILLKEHDAFHEWEFAAVKTILMFTGEYEFAELFSVESRDQMQYKPVLILFFVTFLVVMTIVLMNMLIGLAVDNISGIQADADLQRLCSEIEMVLNIRRRLPNRFKCMTKEARMKVITIKKPSGWAWGAFMKIGHLMSYDKIRENYLQRKQFCVGLEKSKRIQ